MVNPLVANKHDEQPLIERAALLAALLFSDPTTPKAYRDILSSNKTYRSAREALTLLRKNTSESVKIVVDGVERTFEKKDESEIVALISTIRKMVRTKAR